MRACSIDTNRGSASIASRSRPMRSGIGSWSMAFAESGTVFSASFIILSPLDFVSFRVFTILSVS